MKAFVITEDENPEIELRVIQGTGDNLNCATIRVQSGGTSKEINLSTDDVVELAARMQEIADDQF